MQKLTAYNLPKIGQELTVDHRARIAAAIVRIRASENPMRNWYLYRFPSSGVPIVVRLMKYNSRGKLVQVIHIAGPT
jgi:hypothetical protein